MTGFLSDYYFWIERNESIQKRTGGGAHILYSANFSLVLVKSLDLLLWLNLIVILWWIDLQSYVSLCLFEWGENGVNKVIYCQSFYTFLVKGSWTFIIQWLRLQRSDHQPPLFFYIFVSPLRVIQIFQFVYWIKNFQELEANYLRY